MGTMGERLVQLELSDLKVPVGMEVEAPNTIPFR